MKIRTDFITNSSSSSFVISKQYLTLYQINKIYDHIKLCIGDPDFHWNISEDNNIVQGNVFMDNFDMYNYFEEIGINPELAEWSD